MNTITLGGVEKVRRFLATYGLELPIFQINIYEGSELGHHLRWIPGEGQTTSLSSLIAKLGPTDPVADACLKNDEGSIVLFSHRTRLGMYAYQRAWREGLEVVPETNIDHPLFGDLKKSKYDHSDFRDLRGSVEGLRVFNLAVYGKLEPAWWGRL